MPGSTQSKGVLIAVEGVEGAGKSTLCRRLSEVLCGEGILTGRLKFPNRHTPTGQLLTMYLRGLSIPTPRQEFLLFAANRQESSRMLDYKLRHFPVVLCDRYVDSGAAYAMSSEDGITREWCQDVEGHLPQPNAVLFLDLPPSMVMNRCDPHKDLEEIDLGDAHKDAASNYHALQSSHWTRIDARLPEVDVLSEALDICRQWFPLREEVLSTNPPVLDD